MSEILHDIVSNALRAKSNKKVKASIASHNLQISPKVSADFTDDFNNSTSVVIDTNLITPIITICNTSERAANDIIKQIVKHLKIKKLSLSDILRCLYLINDLFNVSSFRQSLCCNSNYLKSIMEIGQFQIKHPSKTIIDIRHQLCLHFETWYIKYNHHHPQLSMIKTYLEQKYNYQLSFHLTKMNQEKERKLLQKKNIVFAQCASQLMDKQVEVYKDLGDIRTNIKSLENLMSIIFPLHSNTMIKAGNYKLTMPLNPNDDDDDDDDEMNNDNTHDNQYEWADSDDDDDDDANNDDDDNDDEVNADTNNGSNNSNDKHMNPTHDYDDIDWEDDAIDDENGQLSKRLKLSIDDDDDDDDDDAAAVVTSVARIRSGHVTSSSSLLTQMGSAPYTMEITFSTDPLDMITADNEILLTQASEIATHLIHFTLPRLMQWKTLLNETLEYLVSDGDDDGDNSGSNNNRNNNNNNNNNSSNSNISSGGNNNSNTNNTFNNSNNNANDYVTITEFRFQYDKSKLLKLLSAVTGVTQAIGDILNGSYKDLIIIMKTKKEKEEKKE